MWHTQQNTLRTHVLTWVIAYLTSILSMPFGPKDVFMRLATVRAAMILIYCKTESKKLETIRESQFGFFQKKFKSGSRSTLDPLRCILKSVREMGHSDHLLEENWYEIITYFVGFKTLDSLFLLLFAENDERSAVLVKCKTHDALLWSSKWDKGGQRVFRCAWFTTFV